MIKLVALLALLLALLLACTTARAYECDGPECPEECPIGSYYYTNFSGLEFCTFDGVKLPSNPRAECGELNPTATRKIGWVGYSFPLAGNDGYQCSVGFSRALDEGDRGLCVAAAWPAHDAAFAYCDYLTTACDPQYGCYMGYGWSE